MKNILLIILLSVVAFSASARSFGEELLGNWRVEPFLVEQEDGLLVSPESVYAYPYTGISEIVFLDSGFVVFIVGGTEYRAFYEIENLDFDNYHISCMFKDGEEFQLKLVKAGNSFRLLYRIGSDSILKGPEAAEMSEADAVMTEPAAPDEEQPEADVVESLYTGLLVKK